ncbi:MAG: GTPase ObgE [Candidatus Omnitrophica bacterium]|nr:GTPase ObgE [Candidatus Omnitrophota bacterium]MDD5488392.1 GTPase ObgE [Candidatus Omnitrophota bacterium]
MLIDHAKIYVSGGRGGNGCQSLYKDKYQRKGTPDGGDGGDGGNVVVESDPNLNTLLDFRYNQHHNAGNGKHGGSNTKIGKRGQDRVLKVPPGTIIIDASNGLVMRDLVSVGESVIVAKGGSGGRGNARKCEATPGEPGEEKTIIFELKLVADVGIIGFPNAGKSTLVSRISRARSKIAPYPFTTKDPHLGVVSLYEDTFVVADMPGLIEGAHQGKGLGDRFLRHIERTRVLVHLVDMQPVDGSDPLENFKKLEQELKAYDEDVFNKPRVIAGSKMDLPGADKELERFSKEVGDKVFPVSAVSGYGVKDLLDEIYHKVKAFR